MILIFFSKNFKFGLLIAIFFSFHIAQGKGQKFDSECVTYLRTSSIPVVGLLAEQLMLSQVKKDSLDEYFNINYIDRVKAELASGVPFYNPIRVTGYGPTSDPLQPLANNHEGKLKAYYFNIKGKSNEKTTIEIFTGNPEVEIIAEANGRQERYLLSQDGFECIPLLKLSGTKASMKNETDAHYCSDIKKFYTQFTKYQNLLGRFDYDKCENDVACKQAANDIFTARYHTRPLEYFKKTARPILNLDDKKVFQHVRDVKREYSDQCNDLLKKSSSKIKMNVQKKSPVQRTAPVQN